MKKSCKYLFILISVILNLHAIYPQWTKTSLDTGSVTSFVVSGNNIYAGTDDIGVFLSTDNGTSWTGVSNGLTNTTVADLAVDGLGFFYAATPSGVFITTNNGTSWFLVSQFQYSPVTAIAINGNYIFAGTEFDGRDTPGKVLRSSDFGVNWNSVLSQTSKFDGIYSLANKNDTIIAGTFFGQVAISTDNGSNWNMSSVESSNWHPITSLIFIDKNIYATYALSGMAAGIYCSTNGGSNWFAVNKGLTNLYVYKLAFFENNIFAATGAGVFRSTNNGANWTDISNGLNGTKVGSLIIIGDTIFAGTTTGVWCRSLSEIVDVKTEKTKPPNQFILEQNYPNPFNPFTLIPYRLKERGYVKLTIYDIKGEQVAVLVNQYQDAGYYEIEFKGTNKDQGKTFVNRIASGIYLYRLDVKNENNIPVYSDMKKMVLLK